MKKKQSLNQARQIQTKVVEPVCHPKEDNRHGLKQHPPSLYISVMFSLGRRRDEQALMPSSSGSSQKQKKPTMRERLSNFKDGSSGKKLLPSSSSSSITSVSSQKQQVAFSGDDGIEVSLEGPGGESRDPQALERSSREPVIDIPELIRLRRKLYQKQFSIQVPALKQPNAIIAATNATSELRQHRIPLSGTKETKTSFLDALHLLQISGPKDEQAAVSQELRHLSMELNALEADKIALEQKQHSASSTTRQTSSSSADWDINRMLTQTNTKTKTPSKKDGSSTTSISAQERQELQTKRGTNLTFHLSSNKAKQVFLSKCGAKFVPGQVVTIGPHNCKTSMISQLQYLALLSAPPQTHNSKPGVVHTSLFLSSDNTITQTWGQLPHNLLPRIKDHDKFKTKDITYLSSGPMGSYYAEFASGESWWGSPIDDDDLFQLLQEWAVHRVVFGHAETLEDSRGGGVTLTHSWIIIAKDGKLAWKNLPSKLHSLLKKRPKGMAGLAEASLGPGNSYFCKFLDDTVEYCLPAHIASACEKIQQQGGRITNVFLHPEISKDFVIRHTELNGGKL
ncbi:unnamed protein product [Cylindrotheca closterium]|uniref:Uncharacterized protein n=1 Tax=Cylindrotheca closterium TaxID=2856 RepID=A0AAD2JLX9_9STRA|nr:unnamed protein product [Cylindrotheca closterium]